METVTPEDQLRELENLYAELMTEDGDRLVMRAIWLRIRQLRALLRLQGAQGKGGAVS